ncbi:HK97 gp10 family phage protein [Dielma fastidiosa]|uniref:Bacteriophage HK97-gp10 putative tail-component n=1 Tax=Dielma fastidiosa TaxID=1034346 RepID=A0A318KJ50_9FIRM|nr:HK97 gp10 family phage protein [Dielma fastidiosa]PXX74651.1 bacteriophage HK97-gp10 putative tail-component [Dielma fastidiosa]
MKINIEDLSNTVIKQINNWSDEKSDKINQHVKKRGKEMVEAIKNDSPKKTGKYAKGWKVKVTLGKGYARIKGVNIARPELTHLLENGHKTAGGTKQTKKYPHIKCNEDKFNELLLQDIKEEFQ